MTKSGILWIAFAVIFLFMLACANTKVAAPAIPSPGEPAALPAARAEWEVKWDKLVEAAKKEKTLVAYISTGGAKEEPIKAFQAKFGITVGRVSGRGGELVTKVLAERKAGLTLADVFTTGTSTAILSLKPVDVLEPLEPVLFRPDVLDPKVWYSGQLLWCDRERTILSFLAFVSQAISVNKQVIKTGEVKGWKDLLDPRWKGKITINDPTVPGTGGTSFGVIASQVTGYDYMRKLAEQEPLVMRDQRLQVEWLAQGKYPIAVWPNSGQMAEFLQAGAPIVNVDPMEGNFLSSGGASVMMLKGAPHPNAAKLFVNWLLTKEGQTLYSKETVLQSARLDVTTEYVNPTRLRQPDAKYYWGDSEEVALKTQENFQIAKEIFGNLLK